MSRAYRPWTDEECQMLTEHADWTAIRLAQALGRTEAQVRWKIRKIKEGVPPKKVAGAGWRQDEDQFILANRYLTALELAERLGRTVEAVNSRRKKLRLAGLHSGGFGVHRNSGIPAVGLRPLLAKTCPDCGLLLSAKWFYKNVDGRSWSRRCARCKDAGRGPRVMSAEAQANSTATARKWQELSLAQATNYGQEWTEKDAKILENPDLTKFEKALLLGRSYFAVTTVTTRLGVQTGHPSLGDPTKEQWKIDNPNTKEHSQ